MQSTVPGDHRPRLGHCDHRSPGKTLAPVLENSELGFDKVRTYILNGAGYSSPPHCLRQPTPIICRHHCFSKPL